MIALGLIAYPAYLIYAMTVPVERFRTGGYADFIAFAGTTAAVYGGVSLGVAPGLVSIDASLMKSFSVGGARMLEVKLEAFNVPNRPNFAVPSGRIAFTGIAADGSPVIAPIWGRITSTVTTSRQIQVGAKLTF